MLYTQPGHMTQASRMKTLLVLLSCVAVLLLASSSAPPQCPQQQWPVPYKRHTSRPPSDPFCKALYAFCPNGSTNGSIPRMDDDDQIDLLALQAPVWEFKFGDLLGHFHIYHDAVGFRSKKTGRNYTSEWYELFQLFNCTFPHILPNRTEPLWCNQGAACVYNFIDDKHWLQNGSIKNIARMSGKQFNQLADWIHQDNNTGLFYQTFRIRNSTDPVHVREWFSPYDCANYPFRMFQELARLGAKFNPVNTYYTFFSLISDMPVYLGNASSIFGPAGNQTLAADMVKFYSNFQAHQSLLEYILHAIEAGIDIFEDHKFYYYFNSEYWLVPVKKPFVSITYELVPLPKTEL